MKISAFIPVYNEEHRIHYTMQSLQWCDEIVVVDKHSSDKTAEICKSYGAKVFFMENSDTYSVSECEFFKKCTGDWILVMTASDIIDRSLAKEIKKQINILPEDIGCINVPFKNYILGIDDERSPWHADHGMRAFRNGNYEIVNNVHAAIIHKNNKSYTISCEFGYMYHLTHVTVDMMLDRHTRYWRGEAMMYNEKSLIPAFTNIWNAIKETVKRRKTFLLGWDGIALTLAYVSYYMFSFLYIWEYRRGRKAVEEYEKLRKNVSDGWNDYETRLYVK